METPGDQRSSADEQHLPAPESAITATGPVGLPVITVSDAHHGATADVKAVTGSGDSPGLNAAAAVSPLIPGRGPASGGNSVIINGSALTSINTVRFDTTPASFTVLSDTQATAVAPAHAAATVQVTVTTQSGTSTIGTYTYVGPPVI